ncbi:helix-turn-helix transcriptional regulator [Paractinoplanes atraurantiacus]|uniref:Regulatory protein, luxR family n=1 Tax=Paractinoplanes atraurantiacus TaxID=1036182 RepID=A0A285GR19_9ACTN|nr:helix-turn-helix transcriptional regulator [Actinoplanes atraurantiacus]SNY26009.1 regulatory protein, luxR family [Actinoplanes atraurantiacus]
MAEIIGRTAEMALIEELLRTGGTLAVTGDRGAGKSRLLTAAEDLALQGGRHRVVRLRGPAEPPALIRRILLAVRHDLPGLESDDARAALAFLELAAGPVASDPVRMTRAVLAELDRRYPLLITVDDAGSPAVVLNGVVRALLLATPAPVAGLPTLALSPLGPRDSHRLMETRPQPPTGRARAAIARRAGGNPAALLELDGGDGPIRPAFAAQIADLPEPTRRLLLHLAAATAPVLGAPLVGAPVDARAVAAAAGVADPAWPAGLVVRQGSTVDFVHPLAADAAYQTATAHQRAQAHRALARHLPGPSAMHLGAATFGPDEVVAAGWESAAGVFRSRDELVEAAIAMERAAERSCCSEDAARRLARAAADTARLGAADWTAELNAAVRRLTADPELAAPAEFTVAVALSRAGRQHDAHGIIAAARRAGRRTSVAMTRLAASIAAISGHEEHRRSLAGMLAEVAPEIDPADVALMRLISDPADRTGRDLCEITRPPGPGDDRRTLAVVGTIAALEDRSRLAVDLLSAVLELNPAAGRSNTALGAAGEMDTALGDVGETNPGLVAALIDTGQLDRAEQVAGTVDVAGLPVLRAALEALRAQVRAVRGDGAETMRLVRDAWARIDVEQHRAIHVRLLRAAGLAAMTGGDHDDAYRYLRSMFDREGRPLEPFLAVRGIADLVSAAVRSGHRDEVQPILDGVRAWSRAVPGVRLRLLLHRADALMAEAEESFRRAVEDEAAGEWPFELAMAQLHYGEWLRRARRPRDARAQLSAAATAFEELGAVRLAEYAARELQATGPTARPGVLTPQEQQVAELAARGLRNREIAEQLFISVRTVGAHLNSIYPKLGISGRHHLAAALNAA